MNRQNSRYQGYWSVWGWEELMFWYLILLMDPYCAGREDSSKLKINIALLLPERTLKDASQMDIAHIAITIIRIHQYIINCNIPVFGFTNFIIMNTFTIITTTKPNKLWHFCPVGKRHYYNAFPQHGQGLPNEYIFSVYFHFDQIPEMKRTNYTETHLDALYPLQICFKHSYVLFTCTLWDLLKIYRRPSLNVSQTFIFRLWRCTGMKTAWNVAAVTADLGRWAFQNYNLKSKIQTVTADLGRWTFFPFDIISLPQKCHDFSKCEKVKTYTQVGHSLYTKGNLLLCKRDYLRYWQWFFW